MIVRARVRSKANPNEHRDVEEAADDYETAYAAIMARVPAAWQILHLTVEHN
jgi:hypothetical protein